MLIRNIELAIDDEVIADRTMAAIRRFSLKIMDSLAYITLLALIITCGTILLAVVDDDAKLAVSVIHDREYSIWFDLLFRGGFRKFDGEPLIGILIISPLFGRHTLLRQKDGIL